MKLLEWLEIIDPECHLGWQEPIYSITIITTKEQP